MEKLYVVGIGPGGLEDMTRRAEKIIEDAELIVGYTVYNDLLKDNFPDKEYYATAMRQERERCVYALSAAAGGKQTVLVCGGDSGVYGMASLVLELVEQLKSHVKVEVVPGVTAALGASALAGAPISGDFAAVSLSDLLTPWEVIEKRLKAAAESDFVIALYNPGSTKRSGYLKRACRIMRMARGPQTPCAVAEQIGRSGEKIRFMTLERLEELPGNMFMTVLIGNSATRMVKSADGSRKMVTSRGYRIEEMESKAAESGNCGIWAGAEKSAGKLAIAEKLTIDESEAGAEAGNCRVRAGAEESAEELIMEKSGSAAKKQKRLLIFGGTTEGRQLAEYACKRGISTLVCVATEYGEYVLKKHPLLEVNSRGLMPAQMEELLENHDFYAVIDATHPYAPKITERVAAACFSAGCEYIRVKRKLVDDLKDIEECDVIFVKNIGEAADFLEHSKGRALVTTGSKEIYEYMKINGALDRLMFRILPSEESLVSCRNAGIGGRNIICMQGPFSAELNCAMLREWNADFLVTKISGKNGGFEEKLRGAKMAGASVIAVLPPGQDDGISIEEAMCRIREF